MFGARGSLTWIVSVYVPGARPDESTDTETTPKFKPDEGVQDSHDADLETLHSKLPEPELSTRKTWAEVEAPDGLLP